MNLEVHLRMAGGLLLARAALHASFPRRFHWDEELPRLSLMNRQMFVVHSFFIALAVGLMGALGLFFADALLEKTRLGKLVLAGLTIFWSARLITQLFVYDSRLWRGNRFHTRVHVAFTCLWLYLIVVFGSGLWRQCAA